MGDRVLHNEATYPPRFLGHETRFPYTPLRLAAVLRAPVFFFTAPYRTAVDGSAFYEVVFEPLAPRPRGPGSPAVDAESQ